MILLSEVAERLHDEVRYWASYNENRLNVRLHPDTVDVRLGNSSQLSEALLIVSGLLVEPGVPMNLRIKGNDETVSFEFSPCTELPPGLEKKLSPWKAHVSFTADKSLLSFTLDLPSAVGGRPADILAMAAESGISIQDAQIVLRAMLPNARNNILTLKETHQLSDTGRCFRAAHTLKGSAKTLRAPELAAAARAVEMEASIGKISVTSISRLSEAWNRLELWIDSEVNAHAE